jgi:hypothetical protein
MKRFPVEFEMKVLIVTEDGGEGVATIGLGHGLLPTDDEVKERLQKFEREELESLEGYRLATAPEYWDYICREKTGQTFATPAEWRQFK